MFKFTSKYRHPIISVKTEKNNSDGDVIQEPIKIYFDNWHFQTDDEKIAEFIKKHRNYGAYYWEDTDGSAVPQDLEPRISVTSMDKPVSEQDTRIGTLETEIKELHKSMSQIVSLLSRPKAGRPAKGQPEVPPAQE